LRFEDRFYDDPATIGRIAATFPGILSVADTARIFADSRRDAVEAFIERLDKLPTAKSHLDEATGHYDTFDEHTGWHKHHAGRKGEIGRWRRELSPTQVAAVERILRPWMERFGYRPATPRDYMLKVGDFQVVR
jgi:hypothetical protein